MRDSKIILSSLIIIILLSPAYHFANAQPNTQPPEDSYGLYSNVNPVMAVIMVVLICSFFLVGLFSIFIRHCSESSAVITTTTTTTIPTSKQRGLDPATIETFPIFLYSVVKEIKIGRGALECAVCLSEFEDDETLRLLPKCDHVFHPDCIDAWLFSHVTCPVCRANQSSENAKNTPQITSESGTNIESNQVEVNPNEIVITVVDEDGDHQRRARISGKYPRSHSTGHSLVQPGECTERYTLRLPEEIRKQMVLISSSKLKRTMSFNGVLAREEGSSRKGLDRFDRWVFSLTPPFVSKVSCLNGKVEQVEESSA